MRHNASAVCAIALCLFVSVCLSQVTILLKRLCGSVEASFDLSYTAANYGYALLIRKSLGSTVSRFRGQSEDKREDRQTDGRRRLHYFPRSVIISFSQRVINDWNSLLPEIVVCYIFPDKTI